MKSKLFPSLALGFVGLMTAVGSLWSFSRGGKDFYVFHDAWRLVLSGWGKEIYRATSDRYLYAPGFAWLLAPLGLFSREMALAIWCLAKALCLGFVIRKFSQRLSPRTDVGSLGLTALGVLLLARPVLIDFQYGQVNLFIMTACVWALLGHFERRTPNHTEDFWDALRWFVLTLAAGAKLFALPLLIVPFFVTTGVASRRLKWERIGITLGIFALVVPPLITEGFHGGFHLYALWREALVAKGLPTETHNQSFAALLFHYFSGNATHVISLGGPLFMGFGWLNETQITLISLAWTFTMLGLALGWIVSGSKQPPLPWLAISIAALIVPSHLVWKPYFVMALPLAILTAHQAAAQMDKLKSWLPWIPFALIFVTLNLTGFDLLGHQAGARAEGASLFLIVHLILIANVRLGV